MISFYNKSKTNFYKFLLDKKISSFYFNDKFYNRGYSPTNKIILDNELFLIEKVFTKKKHSLLGNSISLSKNIFQHNFNEKIRFQKCNYRNFFKKNYSIKLLNILNKKRNFLIVTTTNKGGVSVFTNGLKGFLPRSHFYKIARIVLRAHKLSIQPLFYFFRILFHDKSKLIKQKLNIFFLPDCQYNLTFFLPKKIRKFNHKRKKKYRKKTKFNFVFLISENLIFKHKTYGFKSKKNLLSRNKIYEFKTKKFNIQK